MAVSTGTFPYSPTTASPAAVVPVSGVAMWDKIIKVGGLNMTDISGGGPGIITNPAAQITDSTRVLMTRPTSGGTTLRIMMGYVTGDAISSSNDPLTIRVFGQVSGQDFWSALRNLNGDYAVPILIDPTHDPRETGSGMSFTIPDNAAHSWDLDGYDQILVGVEKKYQPASGGSPSGAVLWGKVV